RTETETAARPLDGAPWEQVRQRCPRAFTRADLLAYGEKIGLNYGPQFQGVERLWQGDRESLGEVHLPSDLATESADYLFHPALLAACFQVSLGADKEFNDRDGGLYLPVEIDQVRLLRRPGRRLWCHARLPEKTARWSVCNLDVWDEDGQLVARVR